MRETKGGAVERERERETDRGGMGLYNEANVR